MHHLNLFGLSRGRALSVLVALILLPFIGVHSEDSESIPVYDLEPLVRVAPSVSIPEARIRRDSVRSAKPIDLAAILSGELPLAALSRKSPLAGDLVLRGLTRDNILMTVDETKTFCACPNRMDPPAFHISSQQIEGIRVRPGPFTVDQGGTVGGGVFVRTTEPSDDVFARGYGYAGSFDYWAGGATVGGPLSRRLSALGGAYYQEGGVYQDGSGTPFTKLPGTNFRPEIIDEKAFEVVNAEAKAAYSLAGGGSVSGNYAYQDASDVLYPGLQMDAIADTMNRGAVAVRLPVSSSLASSVEASVSFSEVDHDMSDSFRTSVNNMMGQFAGRGYFMRTTAESAYYGGRLNATKGLESAQLRYGLDAARRLWDADNVVGGNVNDMLPDVVADTWGAWGVYERRDGPWAVEAGARMDVGQSEARDSLTFVQSLQNADTNQRTDILPSVYGLVSRDFAKGWNAYAGLGYASRAPDPQERYISLNRPGTSPDWVGNPDLDPVKSLEIQEGVRWADGRVDMDLSLFHAWLFDTIYLERLPLTAPARATSYTNIDARLYGLSANAGWDAAEFLRLEAGLAWQKGVKETRPTLATNDVYAEVPPLRARLAATAAFNRWSVRADVQIQDELSRVDPDLNEQPIAGWAVLNLAAGVQMTRYLKLSGGVDNVLDNTYAVSNAFVRDPFSSNVIVNEPGRFLYARLGAEF